MKIWITCIVAFLSINLFSQNNISLESNQDIDKFEIGSKVL